MKASEALDAMLKARNVTKAAFARMKGVKPPTVATYYKRQDMGSALLASCADLLMYDLVLVPKGTRLPDTALVIDPEGREES